MTKGTEERLKILQMLEEGKISADEATTLLRAMEGGDRPPTLPSPPAGAEGRYLRINVVDLDSGKGKVNVTIPLGLVNVGLRMAERFAPNDFDDFDFQELGELITSGAIGKLVEVVDAEDNERVEIYVE
ncbi:MAG: hypothetical protein JW900_09215 [Anaerolineae bacterium]|nr:hypothetical protein [Anaerolineae bacterium]